MILPISGNLAQYAANMFPPFRYVVDKINAEGGIKSMGGARIELIVADNASGSAGTASEARRLITQEKVSFIAGPLVTSEMLALVPVLDEHKVPALSFTSGDSRSKYLFTIGLHYEKGYAAPPIEFLTYLIKEKQRNIRTVALVYSNYEAGQQIANFQEKMITTAGLTVAARIPVDRTAQDHCSLIFLPFGCENTSLAISSVAAARMSRRSASAREVFHCRAISASNCISSRLNRNDLGDVAMTYPFKKGLNKKHQRKEFCVGAFRSNRRAHNFCQELKAGGKKFLFSL